MSKQFSTTDSEILQEIMRLRRDVRGNRFIDSPVPDDVITQLLDAALLAPSVGYSQPWQFVIIKDQQIKQQVYQSFKVENEQARQLFTSDKAEKYQALKLEGILEAPVNIAVFYQPSDAPVLGQASMKDMGKFSVVCAIQNMWLMARSLNVGIGWVSIVDPEQVKSALNAPQNSELIGYLCVGYVEEFLAEPELKTLNWAAEKSKKEVIFHNGF